MLTISLFRQISSFGKRSFCNRTLSCLSRDDCGDVWRFTAAFDGVTGTALPSGQLLDGLRTAAVDRSADVLEDDDERSAPCGDGFGVWRFTAAFDDVACTALPSGQLLSGRRTAAVDRSTGVLEDDDSAHAALRGDGFDVAALDVVSLLPRDDFGASVRGLRLSAGTGTAATALLTGQLAWRVMVATLR